MPEIYPEIPQGSRIWRFYPDFLPGLRKNPYFYFYLANFEVNRPHRILVARTRTVRWASWTIGSPAPLQSWQSAIDHDLPKKKLSGFLQAPACQRGPYPVTTTGVESRLPRFLSGFGVAWAVLRPIFIRTYIRHLGVFSGVLAQVMTGDDTYTQPPDLASALITK